MGTTSDKLQRIIQTKSDIKDAINESEIVEITDEPFREYADKIRKLEEEYKKREMVKTVTGEELHADDAANLNALEFVIDGRSEQEISEHGKNLLPTNINFWVSGQYTQNGNIQSDMPSRIRLSNLLPVKPNTTYYFNTFDTTGTTLEHTFFIRECGSDGKFINNIGTVNNQSTITTGNTTYYLMVTMGSSSTVTGEKFTDFETYFEEGALKPFICLNSETDKSFEPFTPNMPSPEYPSEVKSVDGIKNLFDIKTITENKFISNSGVESSSATWNASDYITVSPNTTYVLYSYNNTSSIPQVTVNEYDGDNWITGVQNNGEAGLKDFTYIFTTASTTTRIRICYRNDRNNQNIQLEEGTIAHSYVPYGSWLKLEITGKNMCPDKTENWEIGYYSEKNGEKSARSWNARLINFIKVEPSTRIYFDTFSDSYRFAIRTYGQDKQFIRSVGAKDNGTITTLNSDEYYISASIQNPDIQIGNEGQQILDLIASGEIKPFICLNSEVDKNYSPYQESEVLIDMNKYDEEVNITGYYELSSINNIKDTLTIDINGKTVLSKNIFSYTYKNSDMDTYSLNSDNNNTLGINLYPNGMGNKDAYKKFTASDIISAYSNDFKYYNNINDFEHIYVSSNTNMGDYYTGKLRLYILKSRLNGYSPSLSNNEKIELVKQYLQEHPLTVYGILPEPEEIQLKPTEVKLFEGTNNIKLQSTIPTNMSMTYYKLWRKNK